MTVYVGKDVKVKEEGVLVSEAKEVSIEIDNGKVEVVTLGSANIQAFSYTLSSISGSLSMYFVDKGFIDDVLTFGTSKTLTIEIGSSPDFTLTLTNVVYETIDISFKPEEVISAELSFKAEGIEVS